MKIAILTDSYELPVWKYRIVEKLRGNRSLKLTLLKISSEESVSFGLLRLYETLDYQFFNKSGKFRETSSEKDSLEKVNIRREITKISESQQKKEGYDLIFDLSERRNKDFYNRFSKISKKGICYFSVGENSGRQPEFFDQMFSDESVVTVRLNITDGKHQKTLYSSRSTVYKFSLYLNKNKNYWKMSEFPSRIIDGVNNFPGFSVDDELYRPETPTSPSLLQEMIFILKVLKSLGKFKLENLEFKQQWFIAYEKADKGEISDFPGSKNGDFKVIAPPKDKFFADPFIVSEKGKTFVFFEEFHFPSEKGSISCLEIGKNGKPSPPRNVLEREYHLSYPFIFKHEENYYMIPETLGNKTIELYGATDFPYKWELQKVLFSGVNAVDTTLLHYKGKFWLFSCMSDCGNNLSDELYLYYSDSLFGKWQPHPKNPVVSDTKTARPAGKIFLQGKTLIRPSQENSIRYGYALNFNRIDVLNEHDYKETLLNTVKPEFIEKNLAIHTFNSNESYKVIDGMKLIKK